MKSGIFKYCTLLLLGIFSPVALSAQEYEAAQKQFIKLSDAFGRIMFSYVDTLNAEKVAANAIEGMIQKLDPHSSYVPKEEVERMNEPLEGSFEGIGIQFSVMEDTMIVIQVFSGGPSEKVGILPGDRILYVNDEPIAGMGIQSSDIVKRVRGPKGTPVEVKVKRAGNPDLIRFRIIRDKIPIHSLEAAYMVSPETGYIRLNRFSATTHQEFLEALNELHPKNLILDLRGNGGGYLEAALSLTDEFLEKNEPILYSEGAHYPLESHFSTSRGSFKKGKLVVLIDEYSASASEIVSGAIQDLDRGIIIGRRSFGKGLVQRPYMLTDGSMLRLTVARYYTPSMRCIQRPYAEGKEQYEKDWRDRYDKGELMSKDNITFPDSLRKETLHLHRTIYGGGGIMPDVFIPIDTTLFSKFHRSAVNVGALHETCLSILEKKRQEIIDQYPRAIEFATNFSVPDEYVTALIENAKSKDVKVPENTTEIYQNQYIRLQIKAILARDIWSDTEYFRIINHEDDTFNEALRTIGDDSVYYSILQPKNKKK